MSDFIDNPLFLKGDTLLEIAQDMALHIKGKSYQWKVHSQDKSKIILETPQKSYLFDLDPLFGCAFPLINSFSKGDYQPPFDWPGPVKGTLLDIVTQSENELILITEEKPLVKGWLIRLSSRLPNIVWMDERAYPLKESRYPFAFSSFKRADPRASVKDWEYLWLKQKQEIQIKEKKELIQKHFQKELQSIDARLKKLEKSKSQMPNLGSLRHEAQLLQAYGESFQNETSISVWDWINEKEVKLTRPEENIHSYIKGLFQKAKGLEAHLHTLDNQIEVLKRKKPELLKEMEKALSSLSLPPSKISLPQAKKEDALKGIRQFQWLGALFLVGKSSEDNMRLSFHIAHGNDLWLHVKDYPGSHVVVKKALPETVLDTPQILQAAALLAHHYSSARKLSEVHVSWTWAKWVKKLPGAKTGTVGLQESKNWLSRQNGELLAQLIASQKT